MEELALLACHTKVTSLLEPEFRIGFIEKHQLYYKIFRAKSSIKTTDEMWLKMQFLCGTAPSWL